MNNTTPPFCQGFLRYCREQQLPVEQVRALIEKSAAFDPLVAAEWETLKKTADDVPVTHPGWNVPWYKQLFHAAPTPLAKELLPGESLKPMWQEPEALGQRVMTPQKEILQKLRAAQGPAGNVRFDMTSPSGAMYAAMGNPYGGMQTPYGLAEHPVAATAGMLAPAAPALLGATAKTVGGAAATTVPFLGYQVYRDLKTDREAGSVGNLLHNFQEGMADPSADPLEVMHQTATGAGLGEKQWQAAARRMQDVGAERMMQETFNPQKALPVPNLTGAAAGLPGGSLPTLPLQASGVQVPDAKAQAANTIAVFNTPAVQNAIKNPEVRAYIEEHLGGGANPVMAGLQGLWEWIQKNPWQAGAIGIGTVMALKGLFSSGGGSNWALPAGLGLAGAGLMAPQLKEMYQAWQANQAQAARAKQMTQPWWGPPGERELPNPHEAVAQLSAPSQPGGQIVVS